MSTEKMAATVMATEIAAAVAFDETPEGEGCDLGAGMFGKRMSEWIRTTAAEMLRLQTAVERMRKELQRIYEFDKYECAGPAALTAASVLKELNL